MKKILGNLLKLILIILFFVAVAVASYAVVEYKSWPWWAGASLFGGVLGLTAAIFFVRSWMLRRREKTFVKRIVSQDDAAIAAAPLHERTHLKELQERWKEAVNLLLGSGLRKHGNPLYALPWYMIFGESDSGKSTAVANSKLSSILTNVGPVPGVSATRNCDWWFFEEAVILDTAGRYAIPLDASKDKEEWECFLSLLAKYRKREPLNGLIITLPADRLLSDDEDALYKYGQSLRKRINELMRVLGVRFPVYVLVTKADLIFGFQGLAELLPEEAWKQAMGMVNEDASADPQAFLKTAFARIMERLRVLRMTLLDRNKQVDPATLLVTEALLPLQPLLRSFVAGVFEENSYQEQPLFRGIFFSSSIQKGEQRSSLLETLPSLQRLATTLPGTKRGLFLHDFFSKVLVADRQLFTPILEFLKWKLLTRNLGMAVWLLFLFVVCALMSNSFFGNHRAISSVLTAFPSPPVFSEEVDEQVAQLEVFREKIISLHAHNSHWIAPRMGLDDSLEMEKRMQHFFVDKFTTVVLEPLDKKLHKILQGSHPRLSPGVSSDFVRFLSWRISVLNGRLQAESSQSPTNLELPTGQAISLTSSNFDPDFVISFIELYSSYVAWCKDLEALRVERILLQAWLVKVFDLDRGGFRCLVRWVNSNPELAPITLWDFWGTGHLDLHGGVRVLPAYTEQGYSILKGLLARLRQTMPDLKDFHQREKEFWLWYAAEYYHQWQIFADHFAEGEKGLLTRESYRSMADQMATPDNPYFNLIARMQQAFKPIKELGTPPEWASLPLDFCVLLEQYKTSKSHTLKEASEKAQARVNKLITDLGGKMGENLGKRLAASKYLGEYIEALGILSGFTTSQEIAFKAVAAFSPTANTAASKGSTSGGKEPVASNPFDKASNALGTLCYRMTENEAGSHSFRRLVAAPLDFLVSFITREASSELQVIWEGKVLDAVAHVPDHKLREALFGKNGVVKTFTAQSAAPFLRRGLNGWQSCRWRGISFPFRKDFFAFLNDGEQGVQAIQPEYEVALATVPTSVNGNATEEPYATTLSLACGTGKQELANFNYPEKKVFTWKPEECGTTTLIIQFSGWEMVKVYEGPLGFPRFLSDFRNGMVTFTPEDFPGQKKRLGEMGIQYIKVGYAFEGIEPVIRLLDIKPLQVPTLITTCWQQIR